MYQLFSNYFTIKMLYYEGNDVLMELIQFHYFLLDF